MTRPRLVLVSRRFWPLVGGAETAMDRLAGALVARGCAVTVLTARWDARWPLELHRHGVRVVRLPQPRLRFWGTLQYLFALQRWLRAHRGEFDLAYVSMLKHDAYAVVGLGRRLGFPVVLRAEGAGPTGDCHWQLEARFGRTIKRRCAQAELLVAPSPPVERELIAAGYRRDRIRYAPNGVPVPLSRSAAAQAAARAALAAAQESLRLPSDAPLVVYTGRLHAGKDLATLVRSWPQVLAHVPHARLWLVGDGPEHAALHEQVRDEHLEGSVTLTGAFDDVGDVLAAADAFVLPSLAEGLSMSLLEALAVGLPAVVSDIPANRTLVTDGQTGRTFPPGDASALARALADVLADPAAAAPLGFAGRALVEREYSLDRMADEHCRLFEQLLATARKR